MISENEYLERIVAGIQSISTRAAVVKWNDIVNGRQFDVSVQFKNGTLNFFVLVEVRNRSRPASAEDVEAFVTKTRDQLANKAVMVTVAGYQEGAKTVAKRHGIEIFTISFDQNEVGFRKDATILVLSNKNSPTNLEPEFSVHGNVVVPVCHRIALNYADGRQFELPDEQSQMNYYVKQTKLSNGHSLDSTIRSSKIPKLNEKQSHRGTFTFEDGVSIIPPDEFFFPRGNIDSIDCEYIATNVPHIKTNMKIDAGLFTSPIIYKNELSGEHHRFEMGSLPLGDGKLAAGKFYFTVAPLAYFYCKSVQHGNVYWKLVEMFQNGDLVQADTTQKSEYSYLYLEVTDKKLLLRLRSRLEKLESPA